MFEELITADDGTVKRVVAQSQEELDEAVAVVKKDHQTEAPEKSPKRDKKGHFTKN